MPRRSDVSTFSSSLFAFKPRQVLLLEHQQRRVAVSPPMAMAKHELKPEDESVLISTVAMWLEKKGFSNVLKRFLSAARIEDDTWKAKALNLNEVFSKYQELCNSAWEQGTSQKLEEQVDVTKETNGGTYLTFSEEAGIKKKKKKGKQDATVSVTRQTSDGPIINEDINESKSKLSMESNGEEASESKEDLSTKNQKDKKKKKSKSSSEALDADEKQIEVMPEVTESKNHDLEAFESQEDLSTKKQKDKKKKKSKSSSEALDADEKQIEVIPEVIESKNQDLEAFESKEDLSTKKQKDKKNKKSKSSSEALDADEKQIEVMPEVIESKNQGLSSQSFADEALNKIPAADKNSKRNKVKAAENVVNESEKASKKRKRMDPDETKNQSGGEVVVEESKLKKSKGLEDNYVDPGANGHDKMQSKKKNCMDGHVGFTNLSSKQTDGSTINSNGVDKSTQQKSAKKERNSSAEPKTVNAFQRVKIDEVEFVDERLQDNSYWAKDGADTGYGAKAQEVLGQVKGRDFRHEKTKKKRGSYRGGQIDLQSHSIKFNYSEDE